MGSVSSLVDDEEERRSSVDGEGGSRLQGKIEGGRGRKKMEIRLLGLGMRLGGARSVGIRLIAMRMRHVVGL